MGMLKRLLTLATDHIYSLPVIVLMPHSSCNCRCIMCDIWKANHNKQEISIDVLSDNADAFRKLGVAEVVLSGGEALMHSNLWNFCRVLRERNIRVTLLSTGLLLKKYADEVTSHISEVIVSLDGSEEIHNRIRNIPNAYSRLSEGVKELKLRRPEMRITGRCVLQRTNYRDFENIVRAAKDIGLDQISFLGADVSSQAFNHTEGWDGDHLHQVALSADETQEFAEIVQHSFHNLRWAYRTRFIAESLSKMNRIVQYYRAVNGLGPYSPTVCNAPWVSAVIEADGEVKPCFFHKAYGNINSNRFLDIINSRQAISFRKALDVHKDPVCERCVCSLKI